MFSAMPRMRGLQILDLMRRPDITSAERKRTCALHSTMSALGQKQTYLFGRKCRNVCFGPKADIRDSGDAKSRAVS